MAEVNDRKLYLGPRLRVLRRELGINQTRMAEELGVSASYLNHLERNQRPLTAQMLLRLANTYDIDIRDFVSGGDGAAAGNLAEVFADRMFHDLGVPRHEIGEVAENYPGVAEAVARLYHALVDLRRMPDLVAQADGAAASSATPLDWLREHIQERRNHFPELDDAAERLAAELGDDVADGIGRIRAHLKERHGVEVRVVPADMLPAAVRHYDVHRKRLMLSEQLPAESRTFAAAYQLCYSALRPIVGQLLERAAPPDATARRLLTVTLTNYGAAAILMPYQAFRAATEASGYDLDLLQDRFGVHYEHVAHRLTTLGRAGERGLPFFMLRIDSAGNVSKRFAGEAFPFSRFGGTCPRWNLHAAFQTPGRLLEQIIETPDGKRYFTVSRTVPRTAAGRSAAGPLAIGLGCELKHAARLVYAAGRDLERAEATAIGPACRLCERPDCVDRAMPPLSRSIEISDHQRSRYPYPFVDI